MVALFVAEEASDKLRRLHKQSSRMAVWVMTPVEVESAFARRRREGTLSEQDLAEARERLSVLEKGWMEVDAVDAVKGRARRLVHVHTLGAADALQLAAALVAAHDVPDTPAFVTLDRQLATAAEKEGFLVQPA